MKRVKIKFIGPYAISCILTLALISAGVCFYFLTGTAMALEKLDFPLRINDSLSATFSEYRSNHLHAGLDLRTNRRTGIPVLAPCNGRIGAIYGDENGYGLMLAFIGDDSYIYKFAHLSGFENEKFGLGGFIDVARSASGKRFPFEADLSEKNISVKRGEVIAYSGDTGAGPPHLHFEISDKNGNIFNPFERLTQDALPDNTTPVISSAILIPEDENTLIDAKPLRYAVNFKNEQAASGADAGINVVGSIAIAVKIFDENKIFKQNDSKIGIYDIELKCDGKTIYSLKFDKIDKKHSRRSELVYDMYYSNLNNGNFYYNLYNFISDAAFPPFISNVENNGIIEIKKGERKLIEIFASDYSGNLSRKTIEIFGVSKPNMLKAGEGIEETGVKNAENSSKTSGKKKISKKRKTNISVKTKKPKKGGEYIPKIEYADYGVIIKFESQFDNIMVKNGLAELYSFENNGFKCFFTSYEKAAADPEFAVTIKSSDGRVLSDKIYLLNLYKITPSAINKISAGSYFIKNAVWSDMSRPLYAGNPELIEKGAVISSAGQSDLNIIFSRPLYEASALYGPLPETWSKKNAGLYHIYSKINLFAGNSIEKIENKDYISASIKNVKSLKLSVLADDKTPVLKISKKWSGKLSKPFKLPAKNEQNFISFTLFDKESGICRDSIKYYIDNLESGNFEYFSGTFLNCYLYDFKKGTGLSPGSHSIKVTAADNCGNHVTFEKQFKVQK